jgi:hypothetical protein
MFNVNAPGENSTSNSRNVSVIGQSVEIDVVQQHARPVWSKRALKCHEGKLLVLSCDMFRRTYGLPRPIQRDRHNSENFEFVHANSTYKSIQRRKTFL